MIGIEFVNGICSFGRLFQNGALLLLSLSLVVVMFVTNCVVLILAVGIWHLGAYKQISLVNDLGVHVLYCAVAAWCNLSLQLKKLIAICNAILVQPLKTIENMHKLNQVLNERKLDDLDKFPQPNDCFCVKNVGKCLSCEMWTLNKRSSWFNKTKYTFFYLVWW